MEQLYNFAVRWAAPLAAVIFFVLWCIGEAGRMDGSFAAWSGAVPLVLLTLAIGLCTVHVAASTAMTVLLLTGQLLSVIPAPTPNGWPMYFAVYIALGFMMLHHAPRWRHTALIVTGLSTAAMVYLMLSPKFGYGVGWLGLMNDTELGMLLQYGWIVFGAFTAMAAACAGLGISLRLSVEKTVLARQRNEAVAHLNQAKIDLAVETERHRIGRELHDVLAHSLAVVAAQADGARYSLPNLPSATEQSLSTIAGAARKALLDAQAVIDHVRGDDGQRRPGLEDLPGLLEDFKTHGMNLQNSTSGAPETFTPVQQLAAYRIVQESLTNALKHGAPGALVQLHVDYSGPGISIHVISRVHAQTPDETMETLTGGQRTGHGLPGMHERAYLVGGWLTAGRDEEEFRVTAFIPASHQGTPSPGEETEQVEEQQ